MKPSFAFSLLGWAEEESFKHSSQTSFLLELCGPVWVGVEISSEMAPVARIRHPGSNTRWRSRKTVRSPN